MELTFFRFYLNIIQIDYSVYILKSNNFVEPEASRPFTEWKTKEFL